MGSMKLYNAVLVLVFAMSTWVCCSEKLQSNEVKTLLKIRQILSFPMGLPKWKVKTDFCNTQTFSSVTVACYGGKISQLHIIGKREAQLQQQNISVETLVKTLSKLSSLKVLSLVSLGLQGELPRQIKQLSSLEILNMSFNSLTGLLPIEISSLVNLQTLILDQNKFEGEIPDLWGSLSSLSVLSLRNNSLKGPFPTSLSKLQSLRVIALSHNRLFGKVPDLSSLVNLEKLYLDNNSLGPRFPLIGTKLVNLVLTRNNFTCGLPLNVISSFYQLQTFDVSFNKFMEPFPTSLLSLPSITSINVKGNEFTGVLLENMSCNAELTFVDMSNNLLTGMMPSCLQLVPSVFYGGNCLVAGQNQNPYASCRHEALAVGVVPLRNRYMHTNLIITITIAIGGVLGGVVLVGIAIWLFMRVYHVKKKNVFQASTLESRSDHCPSKVLSDARYISQTMMGGGVGVQPFRSFSLEELEEATDNFDTCAFMGEASHGQVQMYQGQLRDGCFVAIRCLKLKERRNSEAIMKHIEVISKLRHQHLASAIGYCFEYYLDDSSVSRVFMVFEYVANGTSLRHWVSGHGRHKLTWSQRIATMVGVARGIQFLHNGIVPGMFSNNLKIADILMDQHFSPKISTYNLPLLSQIHQKLEGVEASRLQLRSDDMYEFGMILAETMMGRAAGKEMRKQVEAGVAGDEARRRMMVAKEVGKASSDQSLKTAMEMIVRCLSEDPTERPPVEDIIWNLHFMAQLQDAWHRGEDSRCSPPPPRHLPRLTLTSH